MKERGEREGGMATEDRGRKLLLRNSPTLEVRIANARDS